MKTIRNRWYFKYLNYLGPVIVLLAIAAVVIYWQTKGSSFLHIFLPVAVLIVEIVSLIYMAREGSDRHKQIEEMQRTTSVLVDFQAAIGRGNYLASIAAGIQGAKREVLFTSATMEATWERREQEEILETVLNRQKIQPPYEHRGIIAKRPEALMGTLELMFKTQIKCKMSQVLCMTRLRFVVIDKEQSILGVCQGEPDLASAKPTNMSFRVASAMLGAALAARFEELWERSVDPFDYLKEFIIEAKTTRPNYSRKEVRRWLHADKSGISDEWLSGHCPAYNELPADDDADNTSPDNNEKA